ncbi:MAG: YebC/PmpR family DNA-binding transcriptional regulator [Patescibacteria group bacterium]
MSGHSKWSQIKHKKAISDQKRSAIFGKLARLITIAAKGNPDPKTNMRLKAAIDQARAANMPLDNIDRAIQRITDKSQALLDEIRIEALGPGGTAIIISAITDNRNRTIAELRTLLSSHGAKVVAEGSLNWMLRAEPIEIPVDFRKANLVLLEALDDMDDVQTVTTNINGL